MLLSLLQGKITVAVKLRDSNQEKVTIEFIISAQNWNSPRNDSYHFESFNKQPVARPDSMEGPDWNLAIVKQLLERQGTINVKVK
jgi:hypothetical protein